MLPRNRGTIVQVGSALAYRSIPLQSAYCGAKAAIRGFTDSVRSRADPQEEPRASHDGAALGVQHAAVRLGAHLPTKRPQPVPPIFQPEVAARAIYFAATHRRRELWVGWPAVKAILGTSSCPGSLDRILAPHGYDGQHTDEPLPPDGRDNLYRARAGRPRRARPVRCTGDAAQHAGVADDASRRDRRRRGGAGARHGHAPSQALTSSRYGLNN